VIVGLLALALATVAVRLFFGDPLPQEHPPNQLSVAASPSPISPSPTPPGPQRPTYAIALSRLHGLTDTTTPGAHLQLWVTWEPPIVKKPRVQKLLSEALLQRIVPGITPESPATALLQVGEAQLPRLLYGDRFGVLSAVVVSDI
jgi:hypothetical protein